MDDHFPGGFYYRDTHPTIYHPVPRPWGLPLRCMISKNIENLVFAGRNISVTHAAMSSSRVMATCAILGEALGAAVALAVRDGVHVSDVDIKELQQILMRDDFYIPWHEREQSALTRSAKCTSEIVRNGVDRGEENCWIGKAGDFIEYSFEKDTDIRGIRLVFDSDLNRNYYNMPCNYPLNEERFKIPKTLIKEYRIEAESADGKTYSLCVDNNYQRFVRHHVDWKVKTVRFVPVSTNGSEEFRVFDFELE